MQFSTHAPSSPWPNDASHPSRPHPWPANLDRTRGGIVPSLTPYERRVARLAAFALFSYVLLASAWVNDDAYITFRVIDNWFQGYGLRWNVVERVQVYTHPLWMFLLSGLYAVTGELFYSSIALSVLLSLSCLAIGLRAMPRQAQGVALFALLLSSKAFIDYTSSGLENPLTYALYAWFALVFLRTTSGHDADGALAPVPAIDADRAGRPLASDASAAARTLGLLTLIAALAFVNRIDSLLPLLPALLHRAWIVWRAHGWRALGPALLGGLPAMAWLLFAVVYYGFPFPNTYYAKIATGLPDSIRLQQGFAYLTNSLRFDPITLVIIAIASGLAFLRGSGVRALAAGLMVGVAYVVWVGGDYMSGRFLAAMAFLGALLVARALASWPAAAGAIAMLAMYNIVWPQAPIKTTAAYEMAWPWQTQNGIKDERGAFHKSTNLLGFAPFSPLPDFPYIATGESLRAAASVAALPTIGMAGFHAGPETYIIDVNGLGDPLMARLPVDESIYFDFWTSHYTRPMPEGYERSRETGENHIADPLVHAYFDRLRLVTSGPIWSWDRWKAIGRLNLGSDRHFHEEVFAARRLDLSVRVDTPRFSTDVGERTPERQLRATGKPGFLLLGPSVPLREGVYDVEWHGLFESAPREELGFLLVCYDQCRAQLVRQPLTRVTLAPGSDLMAAARFRLPDHVRDVEYRFYVREGVKLSLSRVAVRAAAAEPAP